MHKSSWTERPYFGNLDVLYNYAQLSHLISPSAKSKIKTWQTHRYSRNYSYLTMRAVLQLLSLGNKLSMNGRS